MISIKIYGDKLPGVPFEILRIKNDVYQLYKRSGYTIVRADIKMEELKYYDTKNT